MHKRERSCKKFINYQPPKESKPELPKEPKEPKELKQVPVEAAPSEELQPSPSSSLLVVPHKEPLNLLELKSEVDRLNSVMVEYMKKTEERFEKLAVLLSRSG